MNILVDSSVWIDYFRSGNNSENLDILIDQNIIVINDLILAELAPSLILRKEHKLISLLKAIQKIEISIDWHNIINLQLKCLMNGINKIGISDLIIVQNAIANKLKVYTLDKHFELISKYTPLQLY